MILSVTVSTAERMRHARLSDAEGMRQIDGVLHNVVLVGERRINVDRGIGNEKRSRIAGRVDGEDVAHPPCGAQAPIMVQDRVHEFVRVKRALHKGFSAARARHGDSCLCRRIAVFCGNDLIG